MLSLIADVLFRIILGPAPLPPTQAELDAHDEADPYGASQWTPWDEFEFQVEWREQMLWLGPLFALRWRLACVDVFGKRPLKQLNPWWRGRAHQREFEARQATAHIVRRTVRSAVAR